MEQAKSLAIKKEKIFVLIRFAVLLAIAIIAPFFGQQAITGSIVNATLFIATALFGVQAGILIGLIPASAALFVGLLPLALAPMIPFIITANIILVIVFGRLKEKNYWLAVVTASLLKFVFLFSVGSIIVNLFLKGEVAPKAAMMMSWPQLFTALSGGIIAYLFLKSVKKKIF